MLTGLIHPLQVSESSWTNTFRRKASFETNHANGTKAAVDLGLAS